MTKSGIPHTLHIRRVFVPGVGKRFALIQPDGTRLAKLYKTFKCAQAGRHWNEVNSLIYED